MKTVQVRNITLGEGRPKICVPIVGQTKDDILLEAETFARIPVDVVESVSYTHLTLPTTERV